MTKTWGKSNNNILKWSLMLLILLIWIAVWPISWQKVTISSWTTFRLFCTNHYCCFPSYSIPFYKRDVYRPMFQHLYSLPWTTFESPYIQNEMASDCNKTRTYNQRVDSLYNVYVAWQKHTVRQNGKFSNYFLGDSMTGSRCDYANLTSTTNYNYLSYDLHLKKLQYLYSLIYQYFLFIPEFQMW